MTDFSRRVYDSMVDMLSSVENPTPIVRLNRVTPYKHTQVYAKLEWYNPFGAVKDRVAANLLRDAEEKGLTAKNLVEPTSGNTGMGLAMMANAKRYNFTACLSVAVPFEKRVALRVFGAKLIELEDDLCPMPGAPEGAMERATELSKQPGWHQLNQYKNPANPDAHFRTTGPEIWRQTDGKVTHFVAGLGTCGTITGTGRFLKSKNPGVKVIGAYPEAGHDIPGVRSFRALKLTDFFLPNEYDGMTEIQTDEAYALTKRLLLEESIIAGPSSGMALAGAFKLVPDVPGGICVVIFPDNAFKYTASFQKHFPELFPAAPKGLPVEVTPAGPMPVVGPADEADQDEAIVMVQKGALLIDVRTPKEFEGMCITEAVNIPLKDVQAGGHKGLPSDKATLIVTICGVGKRSIAAVQALKAQGYTNVRSVKGGMDAWARNAKPLKIR